MKTILMCLALMFAQKQTAQPALPAPPPSDLKSTVRLDRTAVWVGDQFHYLIIVDYPANYEFVLDNLTKDTVNMDPFQVLDVRANPAVRDNGARRLFVDMTLANFTIGKATMEIPQFTLYYFRKDSQNAGADQAAAESLTIPATLIETRSTLPEKPSDIRDAVTVNSWERSRQILPALAWLSLVVLLAGVGRELVLAIKRRKERKGPDRRNAMKVVRSRWFDSVPSEFTDPKTCSEFFDKSYQNVKEYVGYYLETPTMGLTADEMREEMKRLGASSDLTERVAKVMETCETLRYTRNGVAAHGDDARRVADDMREILNVK
jgi:hypothetical protein